MAALPRFAVAIGAAVFLLPAATVIAQTPNSNQTPARDAVHLGVATCSGGNCHGATERPKGSPIAANEYVVWSSRDKHRKAYSVLLEKPSLLIARALGLPDAAHQKLCLDCHADNVAPSRRGPQFQLSDGVGCEACHGGASTWLGVHIARRDHRDNVLAGLVPLERPVVRAETCLACHFGEGERRVDHRLYGAGHPRLRFELDTFTAAQPAHFTADAGYVERKGSTSHLQVWATGQAVALVKRIEALLKQKSAQPGLFPDFALYDCQSCHHPYQTLHGPRPSTTGLLPGTVRLEDSNAAMLEIAGSRVAPGMARQLGERMRAVVNAAAEDRGALEANARAVIETIKQLAKLLEGYRFGEGDTRALASALFTVGHAPDEWLISHAEQTAMALEAIVAAREASGAVGAERHAAIKKSMDALLASFASDESFNPNTFDMALRELQRALAQ